MINRVENKEYLLLSLVTFVTVLTFMFIYSTDHSDCRKQIAPSGLSISVATTPSVPLLSTLISGFTIRNPFFGSYQGTRFGFFQNLLLSNKVKLLQNTQDEDSSSDASVENFYYLLFSHNVREVPDLC